MQLCLPVGVSIVKKKKGFTLLYSFFLFFGIDAPSELKKLTDSYGKTVIIHYLNFISE